MNSEIPVFLETVPKAFKLIKSGPTVDIWMIVLDSGQYCIKHYKDNFAHLRRQAEFNDLLLLSEVIPDALPEMYNDHTKQIDGIVLCMDWLENPSQINTQNDAASVLAKLHQKKSDFAGLHYGNFIGELTQKNDPITNWPSFWVNNRLMPQMELVATRNLLQIGELKLLEKYMDKVSGYLPALQSYSLLHGDLWHGNILSDKNGKTFFIDPAAYFGDPWVDIAMTELFGGFDNSFYDMYKELSKLDKKGKELIPHYQLYYLLVHLNIFGRSYYPDISRILFRYV